MKATVTVRTIGLDSRIGVLHAEVIGRGALACDVMEAVRPQVDTWVLDYLRERVFDAEDFFETREGQCELMLSVTSDLVSTMPVWGRRAGRS